MSSRLRRALASTPTRRFTYLGEADADMDTLAVLDRHTRRRHVVPAMLVLRGMPRFKFNSEAEARAAFSKECGKLLVSRG